jgi:hypothetical protein
VLCFLIVKKKKKNPLTIFNFDDVVKSHENQNFHLYFLVKCMALQVMCSYLVGQLSVGLVKNRIVLQNPQ